jgi:hypothetical protein
LLHLRETGKSQKNRWAYNQRNPFERVPELTGLNHWPVGPCRRPTYCNHMSKALSSSWHTW